MKLKKIASLALAGIMAVSMLTACGEGGSSSSDPTNPVTPTSDYTSDILGDTASITQTIFQGQSNAKLDQMVEYLAANNMITVGDINPNENELTVFSVYGNTVKDSGRFMGNSWYMQYCDGHEEEANKLIPALEWNGGERTVYTLLHVSRYYNDDKIDSMVADYMDEIAMYISNILVGTDDLGEYSYNVSIAKADSVFGSDADRTKDSVIVAIAWNINYTPDTF